MLQKPCLTAFNSSSTGPDGFLLESHFKTDLKNSTAVIGIFKQNLLYQYHLNWVR